MKMLAITVVLVVVQICTAPRSMAADVYSDFPDLIDPLRSYVIYSHGRIVEGDDPRPVHERWGMYDFPAIVSKLAEDSSFVMIAHHRSENSDLDAYVDRLEEWVRKLTEAGVEPERITLVGFSRGGYMTAVAASRLKPMSINTALLGTCWKTLAKDRPDLTFSGRLLSIYETTDSMQSCEEMAANSTLLSSFEEVPISTGKEHGAFYTPLSAWVDPLLLWIKKDLGQLSGG